MRGNWRGASALLLAVVATGGCALFGNTQAKVKANTNTVKLGVLGSFSGTSAASGAGTFNGVSMAIARLNAGGGVLGGRQLEALKGDEQSSIEVAPKAAADLIAKGAVVLIGTNSSGSSKAVINEVLVPRSFLMISPSATSPSLSNPAEVQTGGWFFRTCPNDSLQGVVVAKRAIGLGYKKLAVIAVDTAYGTGFAAELKKGFEATAGHTAAVVKYPYTDKPNASYNEVVGQALATEPDAIMLIAYAGEGSVMIKDWRDSGKLPTVPWMFGDGLQDQAFMDNVQDKKAVDGFNGTAPYSSPEFTKAYAAQFNGATTSYEAGCAFDAAVILGLAIESGKSEIGSNLKDHLVKVSAGDGTVVGPDEIPKALELLRSGQKVNYDGYSGKVDLQPNGDVASGNYTLWTVKDGKIIDSGKVLTP